MNDGLVDAFRHNAWATREFLQVCRELPEDQLQAEAPGQYGSIIDMFLHLVSSETHYLARLTGEEPTWDRRDPTPPSWDETARRTDELAARWERFLAQPFDAERTFVVPWHDGFDRDVPAGVVLAQALYHGNLHRAQVATILTTIGVTPPEWGLWDWAEVTDRAQRRAS
jgi:uncharacterized damage-inducible protein DinB